jgi:hypothetical protein
MKKKTAFMFVALVALVSGCTVYEAPPPGPAVVVAPTVEVVPVTYVWDGFEYVGDYNGQFYYFGPAGGWLVCDAVVWGRFHTWQGYHPDWRAHVIRNDGVYRLDRAHRVARFSGPAYGPRPAVAPPRQGAPAPRPAAQYQHPPTPSRTTTPQKKQEEEKKDNR